MKLRCVLRSRVRARAAALALVILAAVGGLAGSSAAATELTPDPALQDAIRAVARAADEAALERALDDVRARSAPDHSDLVPQLALFLQRAEGEREGMTAAVIVDRLDISRDEIERAIAPYRDVDDPALRAQLENLLGAEE